MENTITMGVRVQKTTHAKYLSLTLQQRRIVQKLVREILLKKIEDMKAIKK